MFTSILFFNFSPPGVFRQEVGSQLFPELHKTMVLIRQPQCCDRRAVPGHSLCAHPNKHICQAAQGHPLPAANHRKTDPKRYHLLGGLSMVEQSQITPLAMTAKGMIREHS